MGGGVLFQKFLKVKKSWSKKGPFELKNITLETRNIGVYIGFSDFLMKKFL